MPTDSAGADFQTLLAERQAAGKPLILDGAVGTELDNRGAGLSAPLWSGLAAIDSPELLLRIHREYVEAGAEVVTACTFRTGRRNFERAGLGRDVWERATREAVSLARKAAGTRCAVAGSVGPLEDCFVPERAPSGEDAEREHAALCRLLVDAGADVLWLETFGAAGELSAALRAAAVASDGRIPVAVSVTTDRHGNLISQEPLSKAVSIAEAAGAVLFCINCVPVTHVRAALPVLRGCCTVPFGVYANLGVPEETQDWRGSAYLSPDVYAAEVSGWAGAAAVGGCCGSTPAHIRALCERFPFPT